MPGSLTRSLSGSQTSLATSACTSRSRDSVTGLRREKTRRKFYNDPASVYGVQPAKITTHTKSGFSTRKHHRSNSTLTDISTTSSTVSNRSVAYEHRRSPQRNAKRRLLSASSSSSVQNNNKSNHGHRPHTSSTLARRNSSRGSHSNRAKTSFCGAHNTTVRAKTASSSAHNNDNNNNEKKEKFPKLKPKARRQIAHQEAYRMFLYQAFRHWQDNAMASSAISTFRGDYKQATRKDSLPEIKTLAQLEKLLYETLESLDKVNLKDGTPGSRAEGRLIALLQGSVREFLVRPVVWRGLNQVKRTSMVQQYNAAIDKWYYGSEYDGQLGKDNSVSCGEKQKERRVKDNKHANPRARTVASTKSEVLYTTTSRDSESVTSSALSDSISVTSCETLTATTDSSSFQSFTSDDEDTSSSSDDDDDDDDDDYETTSSSAPSDSAPETPRTAPARESRDGRQDNSGPAEIISSSRRPESNKSPGKAELSTAPPSIRPGTRGSEQPIQKKSDQRQEEIRRLVNKVTGIMRFYNLVQDKLYERELKRLQEEEKVSRNSSSRLQGRDDQGIKTGSSTQIPLSRSTSQPAVTKAKTPSAAEQQHTDRSTSKPAIGKKNDGGTSSRTGAQESLRAESAQKKPSVGGKPNNDKNSESKNVRPHSPKEAVDTGPKQPKKSSNRKLIKNRKQNGTNDTSSSPTNKTKDKPEEEHAISQEEKVVLKAVDKFFEEEDRQQPENSEDKPASRQFDSADEKLLRPYVRFPSLDQYDMKKTRRKKFYET